MLNGTKNHQRNHTNGQDRVKTQMWKQTHIQNLHWSSTKKKVRVRLWFRRPGKIVASPCFRVLLQCRMIFVVAFAIVYVFQHFNQTRRMLEPKGRTPERISLNFQGVTHYVQCEVELNSQYDCFYSIQSSLYRSSTNRQRRVQEPADWEADRDSER